MNPYLAASKMLVHPYTEAEIASSRLPTREELLVRQRQALGDRALMRPIVESWFGVLRAELNKRHNIAAGRRLIPVIGEDGKRLYDRHGVPVRVPPDDDEIDLRKTEAAIAELCSEACERHAEWAGDLMQKILADRVKKIETENSEAWAAALGQGKRSFRPRSLPTIEDVDLRECLVPVHALWAWLDIFMGEAK